MNKLFRPLRADEISCRVQQCKGNGLSLLIYTDARTYREMLDETVGPLNWKCRYTRDNANCEVSIWDENKSQWISKEDVGTESNTEKEKGLASDSFKRACVRWGLGTELYSAPFIWVNADQVDIKTFNRNGKQVFQTYDKFKVCEIEYNADGRISFLTIGNIRTQKIVFAFGKRRPKEEVKEAAKEVQADEVKADTVSEAQDAPVKEAPSAADPTPAHPAQQTESAPAEKSEDAAEYTLNALQASMDQYGVSWQTVLKVYNVKTPEELSAKKIKNAMEHMAEIKKRQSMTHD